MQYSKKVLDRLANPKHVGTLDENDPNVGTGIVGSPVCGDVMKMQIKVNDEGKIEVVRFQTFGCGSAVASSEYAAEILEGKTIEEALQIKKAHIADYLELPPIKVHCSVLAEDAIKAAVENLLKKNQKLQSKIKLKESEKVQKNEGQQASESCA